jgi:SAM-dependent methyltransferase
MLRLARLIGHPPPSRVRDVERPIAGAGEPRHEEVGAAPDAKAETQGWYWLQHDLVRERVNRMTSGNPHVDTYGRFAEFLAENGREMPLNAGISLGCGSGGLERDLVSRSLIAEIDAYDLSDTAIAEARRLSQERGLTSIRYHIGGLDRLKMPEGRFDAAFSHTSVHRVEALEPLFDNIRNALKPDGFFHMNEFIGPTRFQWTDDQLRLINEYLDSLPARLRQMPTGRKPAAERPKLDEMLTTDPTLAIRSAEIRDVLTQYFDIVEERPYGGTLLHMGLSGIAQNFDIHSSEDCQHLQRLFDLEDHMIGDGVIEPDFAVFIARPLAQRRTERRSSSTRRLRPFHQGAFAGVNLTVSKADNMLQSTDDHYISVGRSAISVIERALGGFTPRAILDLPCGFGRVTRFLRARYPEAAITVSDLDELGVAFCASQYKARPVISVRDFQDLQLNETYDLIWVGSLITHLPAEQVRRFFSAMARHLTQPGRLIVSLHGRSIIPRLRESGYGLTPAFAEDVVAQFERTGFGYSDYYDDGDLYGAALTNEHYGISLTDEQWVRASLTEAGLELVTYEDRAWDDHHDILVASLPNYT